MTLRQAALLAAIATALVVVVSLADHHNPWTGGLTARSFRGIASWSGAIALPRDGTYEFGTSSPDHVAIAIDGRVVSDGTTKTPVPLQAGLHQIYVESHDGRAAGAVAITWSRDGEPVSDVADDALYARRPGAVVAAITGGVRAALVLVEWLWVATLVVCVIAVGVGALARVVDWLPSQVDWPSLRWIVAASLALNAVPLWWGLPAIWAPDELMPNTVFAALSRHFANGWFDRWPPFHYYTLALVWSPILALEWMGRIAFGSPFWPGLLTFLSRLVSVADAAGIVIAICTVASRAFGRRAGLFAAATFALLAPFVYYAKTANLDVPYVFWFALSLVAFQRFLETVATRDAVLFGIFAAVAICTKDQAYALYPLMALAILWRVWRDVRARGAAPWRVPVDRRLLAGVLAAVAVFVLCHNLLFNWSGFVGHVRYIVGPGNENYRVFPPTAGGRLALLRLTASLIQISWGWPLTVIAMAGLVMALGTRRYRAASLALLAAPVAYYLTFINVVLYNYDRFVIPICLVLSMFAGLALDRFSRAGRPQARWRIGGIGALFAYSLLYAMTVDVLMLNDSRYAVERWVRSDVAPGELLAVSGPRELQPKLDRPWADIPTLEDLRRHRPAYYILSADYARAVSIETDWGQLIAALESGRAGYDLVARVRCPSPWPWLPAAHPELTGPRDVSPTTGVFSVLRDIDPTIDVFGRSPAPPAGIACSASVPESTR